MSFTTIDITNMMRGEGEWKNMQEIVRRTLKICFDQMEKQGDQIALLTGQVASLKTQIVHKANRDELSSVNKLNLAAQLPKSTSREFATHAELDKLKDQVIHIRNDVERKASVRYVDESLRRKVDRSDLLVKNLATFSAAQYSSQLTQMFQELTETKAAVESLSHTTSDMQRNLQGVEDVHVVKHQMEAIYRSMGDYFTKNHIKALLDQKQDIAGLDAVLSKKADCSALQANMDRTEAALESHEKTITALRVKLNDVSLFDARSTLARNTAQPLFSSSEEPCRARKCVRKRRVRASSHGGGSGGERKGEGGYVSSGYESSASTGSCICNHAEVGGGNDTAKTRRGVRLSGAVAGADMESVLRDGRVQALIEGLWTKVDNAEGSAHRLRQELDGQRGALSRIEATLSQVAGASQMETLGLVVEEQRRRIDSILTGSIPIESITEEFMRQQGDISELQAFLSLPQHKPLREQLAEAGDLIDVLSRKVAEQGAALGRAGLRIEAMEAINRQLETRVQMAENSREKVAQIQHLTDLAGTEFTSMKDLAKRLSAACAVLVGADIMSSSAMTSLAGKSQPVLTRVHSLETETAETVSQLRQLETRLRELKQITVGICSTQGSRTGGSTATRSYSEPGLSPFSPGLGGGNFSPDRACESSQFHQRPAPSSPVRRGGETRFRGAPGLVVGESRPASPLRSPSLSPSHSPVGRSGARSGGNSSPGRRVRFPGEAGMDMCSPGAADADASRLSVDFEQALGQVFSSSPGHHDADAHVPVQQVAPLVPSTSRSAHASLGFGTSLATGEERPRGGSRVTVQTSSLRRVDERLDELKVEKERLRRLLMSKVESL